MWPFGSSLASQVEALRAAERRLLELAQTRFEPTSNVEIVPFDTKIPCSVVPVKSHSCDVHKDAVKDETYVIHAVKVTNSSTAAAVDKTSRAPLVMLHGYMNGASYFYRNFTGLCQYFSTIYSLDLLGWGLSSRPRFVLKDDKLSTAEDFFVESLEAWRHSNQIEKMTLAGHSLGGYLGVAYSERYPQYVERLILISPAGVSHETEEIIAKRRARQSSSWRWSILGSFYAHLFYPNFSFGNIIRMAPSWSERKCLEYVEKRIPDIKDEDERKAVSRYLFMNSRLPGSGEHCLSRFLNPYGFGRRPAETRISHLQIPHVCFLYGQNDWMDAEGGLNVQKLCEEKGSGEAPTVDVYQISDAGHLLMLDNWQEFNIGMALAVGLQPRDNDTRPVRLVPGRYVPGHDEAETWRRTPNESVAT